MPALNIKNDRAHQMAQELAELTGESQTEAVMIAMEERIHRIKKERSREGIARRLMEIAHETGPLFVEPYKSMDHGDLLYDENGLPK